MDIWQVKTMKIGDLVPNAKNPRKISKEKLEALQDKIQRLGFHNPIKVDENLTVLGGNQRLKALLKIAGKDLEVPVMFPNRPLTKEEKDEIIITDNVSDGEWDWDILTKEWSKELTESWGLNWDECDTVEEKQPYKYGVSGSIKQRYLACPFSILDAKSGDWQDRKKYWLDTVGINSGIGRKEGLIGGMKQLSSKMKGNTRLNGTSVFDPVLCELMYSWFSKKGDKVIDPFAGGSVRGVVASCLERDYTGIDLRPEQIEENEKQTHDICTSNLPKYITGDSSVEVDKLSDNSFDFCLSCPPYADLEQYSDDPKDLSNMDYQDFMKVYEKIISDTYKKLKDNTFVAWVIGEVRENYNLYYGFVPDTIRAFEKAGFGYYNEIILATSIASAMLRTRCFQNSRKVVKIHQNVLIFVKGDAKKAVERLGEVEIKEFEEENSGQ